MSMPLYFSLLVKGVQDQPLALLLFFKQENSLLYLEFVQCCEAIGSLGLVKQAVGEND